MRIFHILQYVSGSKSNHKDRYHESTWNSDLCFNSPTETHLLVHVSVYGTGCLGRIVRIESC